jgi:hypothetical protein
MSAALWPEDRSRSKGERRTDLVQVFPEPEPEPVIRIVGSLLVEVARCEALGVGHAQGLEPDGAHRGSSAPSREHDGYRWWPQSGGAEEPFMTPRSEVAWSAASSRRRSGVCGRKRAAEATRSRQIWTADPQRPFRAFTRNAEFGLPDGSRSPNSTVVRGRIELPTPRFSVVCSTN